MYAHAAAGCPGNAAVGQTYYYLFKYYPDLPDQEKRIPEMTGAELKASGTQADFDQFGQPVVRLAFTSKGNKDFQRITRELYQRGRLWKQPQQFAIVLDREIKSFPQIDYTDPSLSNGIIRQRGPDHEHRLLQRGEGPRDRSPDRRAAVPVHPARADAGLRDAREGLAEPGEDGGR